MSVCQSTSPVWGMTIYAVGLTAVQQISIHIPRVGDDPTSEAQERMNAEFQSTSPVWGMTREAYAMVAAERDFNPHPPCGG